MLGLAVLFFFVVYFLLLIVVTSKAVAWAKAHNRKPWLWGGLVAFVMYNLVFWDWIPTVVAHKYYCSTQAGFTEYKTLEEWKKENPNDYKSLKWKEISDDYEDIENNRRVMILNQRFLLITSYHRLNLIPVTVFQFQLVDKKNNEILGKYTEIGTGYNNPMLTGGLQGFKNIWLDMGSCEGNEKTLYTKFVEFYEKFRKIGEKK